MGRKEMLKKSSMFIITNIVIIHQKARKGQ
jgi:hypothetical protein